MKNPKYWNKKQKITGIAILSVLVLGGIGTTSIVAHNNNVAQAEEVASQKAHDKKVADEKAKEQKAKELKAEKEKQASAEIVLNNALVKAENDPTEENIKATEVAMKPVENAEVVKKAETSLKAVKTRYTLISEAKKAVSEYQKDAMNDSKKIAAHNAVAKLKDSKDKAVVTTLTNQVSESTKQADTAKAVAVANDTKAKKEQASTKASASGSQSAKASGSNNSSSTNKSSGSSSNSNSYSQGWTQRNGSTSNANQSSNTGNGSSNSSSSKSSGGTKSSSYNGAYGNSKEAEDKLNKASQKAANETQAPSGWKAGD